ncbi:MAG: 50S ribosomal protein L15 [Parcubacteria group bacterium CG11_big_fil_rev_8_21_14_0_20_39_14]|nr:MAG: 50S ribosomal protein L15 [Parcubacteria group bacterium CG11_big_fil_rev_8_21_14_0_20_39_14]PIS35240.1 MAG: 50S ribosomal protein L15 [Parcubacteria group bacterium CG08_land_8_20_14_0_20_38_56]
MQLHELKPIHKLKKPKRVGRGGKRGTYSGRGMKGQKSRAGARIRPESRDLIKRIPKLRGYRFKSKSKKQRAKITEVNIEVLNKKFEEGEKVTPQTLLKKGIVRKIKGRLPGVKLLGNSSLNRKLLVERCKISEKAKEKIEKAGGSIK